MNVKTLSILALAMAATTAQADALPQQPTPDLFIATEGIEINGQDYRKVETATRLSHVAELQAGDEVFKNAFTNMAKATGLIYVTVTNEADAKAIAKELKLDVIFAKNDSAVLKAAPGQNLLAISDYLDADSRIKATKIDLNSGKYQAQ